MEMLPANEDRVLSPDRDWAGIRLSILVSDQPTITTIYRFEYAGTTDSDIYMVGILGSTTIE